MLEDEEAERALKARMLVTDVDPPCRWFTSSRCKECCVLCISFDMCIKRWTGKERSLYCPLLFRIHYCSAIINWYKKREENKELRK